MMMRQLRKFLINKSDRKALSFYFIIHIFHNAMILALPFSLSILIDQILPSGNPSLLLAWVIFFVCLYIFYHIYTCFVVNYLRFKYQLKISRRLANGAMHSVINSSFRKFMKFSSESNTFNTVIYDTATVASIEESIATQMGAYVVGIIGALIISFAISPVVAIASLLSVPLFVFITISFRGKLEKLQRDERGNADALTKISQNLIGHKRSLGFLDSNDFFFDKFDTGLKNWIKYRTKYLFYYLTSQESPKLVVSVMKVIVMFICGLNFMNGNISLGDLILASSINTIILNSVESMMFHILRRNANKATYKRVSDVLCIEDNVEEVEYLLKEDRYGIKNTVIQFGDDFKLSISRLEIPNNGLCIISGDNGSGKSTVFNLFNNTLDPNSVSNTGSIYVDKSVEGSTAFLSAPHIFIDATVSENILLGKSEPDNFIDIINMLNLQEILNKAVSIHPINLSYGEQQKIALARIFLKNHKTLFLDEPFINLDKDTVERLISHLRKISKTSLVLIISHEVDLSMYADKVFRIEKGIFID